MTRHTTTLALAAVILLDGSACADSVAGPSPAATRATTPSLSAVKFWDANAAANWTDLATSLSARTSVPVGRLSVYLSLAQLRAAEDAEAIVPLAGGCPLAARGSSRNRLSRSAAGVTVA